MGTGTDEKRGLPRRLVRWLQRPTITLVLLAVLGVDLITLEPGVDGWFPPRSSGSTVAGWVGSLRPPLTPEDRGLPRHAYFGWMASEDDIRPVTTEESGFATAFLPTIRSTELRRGFWGVTRNETTFTFDLGKVVLDSSVLEPADLEDRARSLYAATLFEHGDPFWIEAMSAINATGGTEHQVVRWLWTGFARNAASAAGWLVLLLSLGWLVRPFAERRWWRRLGAGRCAACRYEIGVDGYLRPCPECGVVGRDGFRAARWWGSDRAMFRFARSLGQPIITVLLLVMILYDVVMLPVGKGAVGGESGSAFRRILPLPVLRADAGNGVPNSTLYVGILTTPEGGPAYQVQPGSWDAYVAITWQSWSNGLYAPVGSMEHVTLYWSDGRSREREGHADLEGYLGSVEKSEWADALARRHLSLRYPEPLAAGYAHNAAALGAAAMLVLSLRWIPLRVRARRAARRGQCWYCAAEAAAGACRVCGRAALGA